MPFSLRHPPPTPHLAHSKRNSQVVAVRRCNQTSSVHNSRVERHWRDVNYCTWKWKEEFGVLVMLGAFEIGDCGDLFSLHAVYVPLIEVDVEAP